MNSERLVRNKMSKMRGERFRKSKTGQKSQGRKCTVTTSEFSNMWTLLKQTKNLRKTIAGSAPGDHTNTNP